MSVFLSPGVFTREIDLSLYIPNLSTTAYGVVGLASKGPINEPMFVTDPVQFSSIFGDPADPTVEFQPAVYSALQYLHTGRQLWFVRVSEFDPTDLEGTDTGSIYMAKYGKVSIAQSSSVPQISGTTNTLATITSSNNTLTFLVDQAAPGFSVTLPVSGGSTVYSIPQVVALLNSNATFATYMKASASLQGYLVISGLLSGRNHSLSLSGTNLTSNVFGFPVVESTATTATIYGTGNITEGAYILGSNAAFPATFSGSNDTLTLRAGVSAATASNVVHNFPDSSTLSLSDIVTDLNTDGGFSANLTASAFAGQLKISVKPASTFKYLALGTSGSADCGVDVFGEMNGEDFILGNTVFPITIVAGVNDIVTIVKNEFATPLDSSVSFTMDPGPVPDADTLQILLGSNGSDLLPAGLDSSVVTAGGGSRIKITLHTASGYDGITLDPSASGTLIFGSQPAQKKVATISETTLSITSATQGTWANNLAVEVLPIPSTGTQTAFILNVYEKSFLVESYRNLVLTPQTIPDPLAPLGNPIPNPDYVENAINGVSARITVVNAVDNLSFPLPNLLGEHYHLSGGSNGAPPSQTSDPSIYIGVLTNLQTTGLQFFRNPELLDINLISVPGISDAAVLNEQIDICQTRGDAMCIVDPPLGYTPQDVVDWVNGVGAHSDHQAFNSSYAAIYWPWLQIYDPINKTTVFTPPSGHLANVYAFTDLVSDPWIAPAGLTRGRLTTPLKAEYNPTTGERDLLYLNNINPIATFVHDGINVFGQKTLQRKPSALDRVNVRRLLLYLEKVITTASRYLLFEPDDVTTWLGFVNLVEPFMASVKSRRGMTDFQVRCDATTNTPDSIDRSEMHALIFIKPTKAAEFLQIDFVLTAQAANFNELSF